VAKSLSDFDLFCLFYVKYVYLSASIEQLYYIIMIFVLFKWSDKRGHLIMRNAVTSSVLLIVIVFLCCTTFITNASQADISYDDGKFIFPVPHSSSNRILN